MSGSHARLVGLALLALISTTFSVRAQDYLEQKKKLLEIESQKTVADTVAALETSRTLEKKDAAAAKSLLQKQLLDVSDSSSLDEKQRADLRKKLTDRLKEVNATLSEQKVGADYASKLAADKAAREERDRMEKAKYEGQGKSPYDQAKGRIEDGKKILGAYDNLKSAKDKGITDATLEIYKTASKMDEQRITKYFIDKSEGRKNNKLTKEEVALLKALNSTLSVDFKDNSFKEVLEYIDAKVPGGLAIFLDQGSLTDAGVTYESKVTLKAKNVKLRTVLKKVLSDLGLTYVIKEAALQVITPDRVKDYLVARAYPVQDLVTPFNMSYSPAYNQIQMQQQAQQLMLMIVNTIEPSTWVGIGERGYGTISFDPVTKSLIVRHTAEMHYQLGGGLGR